jgi:hypothetical protein
MISLVAFVLIAIRSSKREDRPYECQLLCRVSDAGRLVDGAAYSAAGVRKPPREETALKGT